MGTVRVEDIVVTDLKRIAVEGGDVLHALKACDPGYAGFGEAYFSQIKLGCVKAWKRHMRMTLNLVVPVGMVSFVFVDTQGGRREELVGEEHYVRVTVPPGIWFGFKGMNSPHSLLLNIADIPHDPDEVERADLNAFSFNQERNE